MKGKMLGNLRKGLSNGWHFVCLFADYALVPRCYYRWRRRAAMSGLSIAEQQLLVKRRDYYCRLSSATPVGDGSSVTVNDYRYPFGRSHRFTNYFFDLYEVVRYFAGSRRFNYIHGDVTEVPSAPAFVKSRPIAGDNANAVLLKLNKRRHFSLVENDIPFTEKKDMLVSRTTWANPSPQRRSLCAQYWNHPMCNVGKTRMEENEDLPQTVKGFLSIREQLQYKFIACVEGVDVATNLKWVMSSNSIAVSPRMKYETWFMEGTLIPDYHYIEVKPDFSDLIEKLEYYIAHPIEAQAIVTHAHEYMAQFRNRRLERAVQLAVAERYFELTN